MAEQITAVGNPLFRLFVLDDATLSDPKDLAGIVRKQMELRGMPPELPEISMLLDVLDVVTGKKPEPSLFSLGHARQTLDGWISDYRGMIAVASSDTEYQRLLGEVTKLRTNNRLIHNYAGFLERQNRKDRDRIEDLESQRNATLTQRLRRKLAFVPYIKERILDEIKPAIEEKLEMARLYANIDKNEYAKLKAELEGARRIASKSGLVFEREFSPAIEAILDLYVDRMLVSAIGWTRHIDDGSARIFLEYLDAVQIAAADFKKEERYAPRIKESAKAFLEAIKEEVKLVPIRAYERGRVVTLNQIALVVSNKYGIPIS